MSDRDRDPFDNTIFRLPAVDRGGATGGGFIPGAPDDPDPEDEFGEEIGGDPAESGGSNSGSSGSGGATGGGFIPGAPDDPFPFNEGNVQITGCSVITSVIDPGENGSISFTVSNDNPVNAEFDWRVTVDGSFAESGTNTLLDGSTQTFTAVIPSRSLSEGDNSVSVTVSDAREN
jgi:hypothetical protein